MSWQEKEAEVEKKLLEDPKIDIVITSYNRRGYTVEVLEQLKKRTISPHRVIVVDNGSTDGTVEHLEALRLAGRVDVLILLDRNMGLERAKMIGLSVVRSEYYVDMDNDIIVESPDDDGDWLFKLERLMNKHPEYGAISCRPQVLIGERGDAFDSVSGDVREGNAGAHGRMMRTEAVRKTGWRMNFTNRSEEKWIRKQFEEIGLKTGYAKNIRCIHLYDKNWGYEDVDHYHRDIWPPVEVFSWNKRNIDYETCRKIK